MRSESEQYKHALEHSKSSIIIYFYYELKDFHRMLSLHYRLVKCLN